MATSNISAACTLYFFESTKNTVHEVIQQFKFKTAAIQEKRELNICTLKDKIEY